jgi:PTH1 family peptidyl-tRNA hydrolase
MFLIVGLGNPGAKYENTRHNLGFKALDLLAGLRRSLGGVGWENKYDSQFLKLEDVILAKPQTFMNNSGKSVAQILKYYQDVTLILVHDELDLELGAMRIQKNSSAAGHNGVQSVIDEIGTQDFIRVRLGINNPNLRGEISGDDYVLQNFNASEEPLVKEVLEKSLAAIETIQTQGLDLAQSKFNG